MSTDKSTTDEGLTDCERIERDLDAEAAAKGITRAELARQILAERIPAPTLELVEAEE